MIKTKDVKIVDVFSECCELLATDGAFLVVNDKDGKANPMTIGWAQIGVVWGKPILTVFVRPSRFTHVLIEKAQNFTLCVPKAGTCKGKLTECGTFSGKDVNKVEKFFLQAAKGRLENTTILQECDIFFECAKVETTRVDCGTLADSIKANYYSKKDYHSIYFGEIKHCYTKI